VVKPLHMLSSVIMQYTCQNAMSKKPGAIFNLVSIFLALEISQLAAVKDPDIPTFRRISMDNATVQRRCKRCKLHGEPDVVH